MKNTVRSPRLPSLYAKKTDCVVEWICGVLNEEDSSEYVSFHNYVNDYLAYSEDHGHLLDLYFDQSLKSIRKIQSCVSHIEEINQLFDGNIRSLSQAINDNNHKAVEESFSQLFLDCERVLKIAA